MMIKKYAMLSLFHYGNIFHNLDDAYGKKYGYESLTNTVEQTNARL